MNYKIKMQAEKLNELLIKYSKEGGEWFLSTYLAEFMGGELIELREVDIAEDEHGNVIKKVVENG